MVTSPYVWNILECDEPPPPQKHQTNKQINKQNKPAVIYFPIILIFEMCHDTLNKVWPMADPSFNDDKMRHLSFRKVREKKETPA